MIFALNARVSIYEGIGKIAEPLAITDTLVNCIVLGTAMVFEAAA